MLTIKAEASAGVQIEDTFEQAQKLAEKLDCYVEFKFNDVVCCAAFNGTKEKGAINYHNEISKKGEGFRYAINW